MLQVFIGHILRAADSARMENFVGFPEPQETHLEQKDP